MSINWVMLSPTEDFVRLPSEQRLYSSPSRVSISLDSMNKYPGRQPFHLSCPSGRVYLTNRRLVFVPATPPPQTSNQAPPTVLASFAAPLGNLHDGRVTTPWLGPNAWVAAVQPVFGGGIPTQHSAVELRLTFKDGGAYDLHSRFCELRERLSQARETAGVSTAAAATAADDVHLEQLPAYEETGDSVPVSAPVNNAPHSAPAVDQVDTTQPQRQVSTTQSQPNEPPPGYEEVQRDSVADLLESNLRMGER